MINSRSEVTKHDVGGFIQIEKARLTIESLSMYMKRSQQEGCGLAHLLKPYMIDLLKRKQSLSSISDYDTLNETAESGRVISADDLRGLGGFFKLRQKELMIALLAVTRPQEHSRLVSLYVDVEGVLPLLHRQMSATGDVEMRMPLEGYHDVLCDPAYPLVVSCGTGQDAGLGKTDLISAVFSIPPVGPGSLERNPGGPCHYLSIDLAVKGVLKGSRKTFFVADVHGNSSISLGLRLTLQALLKAAAVCIVHLCGKDVTTEGKFTAEAQQMLDCVLHPNSKASQSTAKSCKLVLWRDFDGTADNEKLAVVKQYCNELLTNSVKVSVIPVPDLRTKEKWERSSIVDSIIESLQAMIEGMGELPKLPRSLDLIESMDAGLDKTGRSAMKALIADINISEVLNSARPLRTIRKMVGQLLNKTVPKGESRFKTLFPCCYLDATISRLDAESEKLSRKGIDERVEKELRNIREKISCTEEHRKRHRTSDLVRSFARYVKKGKLSFVAEFQRQLDAWKAPLCEPLLIKRTELQSELEKTCQFLRSTKQDCSSDKTVKELTSKLDENYDALDQLDFSVDDLWSELMSMSRIDAQNHRSGPTTSVLERDCKVTAAQVRTMYTEFVLSGHPMQLLRGRPLYMVDELLSDVLRELTSSSRKPLFVVSVIGAQSSAKSTLLNYLFGCGFATRAGRCTKGLYVSFVRSSDLDILVLDSEGLMSVEEGSTDFDNEMVLMAIACSHVVLINQMGDIHRHLTDLLEVAVFALKHLQVLSHLVTPDIWFVLRDVADFHLPERLNSQFIKMNRTLTEKSTKHNVRIGDFVTLSVETLQLLPSAVDVQKRGRTLANVPAAVFPDLILELRQKLFERYNSTVAREELGAIEHQFSSMTRWLAHARTVWGSVRKFGGNLTHYQSMHEIEQWKEVSEIYSKLISSTVESPGDGFVAFCDDLFDKYTELPIAEAVKEDTDSNFKHLVNEREVDALEIASHRLESEFNRCGNYPLKLSNEFQGKLNRKVAETRRQVLQAWKQYQARTRSDFEVDVIRRKLESDMDSCFKGRGEAMTEEELEDTFTKTWKVCMTETRQRLETAMVPRSETQRSINNCISDAVTVHSGETVYQVLRPGVQFPDVSDRVLSFYCDVEQLHKYFRPVRQQQILSSLRRRFYPSERNLKQSCSLAASHVQGEVKAHIRQLKRRFVELSPGKLDKTFSACIKSSLIETVEMTNKLQNYVKSMQLEVPLELEVKLFANDVVDYVRHIVLKEYEAKQQNDVKTKMKSLEDNCGLIRLEIFNHLSDQANDTSRSKELAARLRRSLTNWAETAVDKILMPIQRELKRSFESGKAATQYAYEESFGSSSWDDVVEYCKDAAAYLERIFSQRYSRLSEKCKANDEANICKLLHQQLSFLMSSFQLWATEASQSQSLTTEHFVEYVSGMTTKQPVIVTEANVKLNIVDMVPRDITVINPGDFVRSLCTHFNRPNDCEATMCDLVTGRLEEKIELELERIWDIAEGCRKRCPTCHSKCSLEKRHSRKHHCDVHFMPAFGGTSHEDYELDAKYAPTLKYRCTSKDFINNPIKKRDKPETARPNLYKFFEDFYPKWKVPDDVSKPTQSRQDAELKRAWVNCRKQLIAIHKFDADCTPHQWIESYGVPQPPLEEKKFA